VKELQTSEPRSLRDHKEGRSSLHSVGLGADWSGRMRKRDKDIFGTGPGEPDTRMLQKSKGRFLKNFFLPGADGFYPSIGGPMDG